MSLHSEELLSTQILNFLFSLRMEVRLPRGVEVLDPYTDRSVQTICSTFYHKYFADSRSRVIILGINPGRFGGGVTGIPFTDPVALETICGINTTLNRKRELSAEFIYRLIESFGGPTAFYGHFYITALSPLGFTREGKNLNYYDDARLARIVTPFIESSIQAQLKFHVRRDVCFCLGEGQNMKFLDRLNQKHQFFQRIIPLAHPRFIMQYRRKKTHDYITNFVEQLRSVLH